MAEVDSASIRVRRATPADIPAIARLHVATWRHAYRGLMPQSVLDAQDEAKRASLWSPLLNVPGHDLWVAELGALLAGFCSCGPSRDADAALRTGEVEAIYVDPERAGRGVGRALLCASLEAARGRHATLTLWVLAGNHAARRFYEAFGFALDGARKQVQLGGVAFEEVRYWLAVPEPCSPAPRSPGP